MSKKKINAPYVQEGLHSLLLPIDAVVFDEANAVKHDKKNIDLIKKSMTEFGQDVPIVAQDRGDQLVVRKGNGRLQAAIELEWEFIAVLVVKEDDKQGIARGLFDNRSSDFHVWDDDQLQELLVQIEDDFSRSDLGWDDDAIATLAPAESAPAVTSDEPSAPHAPADNVLKRITFTTTEEQATIVMNAVQALRASENDSTITMSRAFELICAEFLSAHAAPASTH
jgi:hypothetical protein